MPSSKEFFERYPTFPEIESVMHDSRSMRPSLQANIQRRFAHTPLAGVLEKGEVKKQADGSIDVGDYLEALNESFGGERLVITGYYSPERAFSDRWLSNQLIHTDARLREYAYKTRELLLKLEPTLMEYRQYEPGDFGVNLTFHPDIPEGVIVMRSSMKDNSSKDRQRLEQLEYDQFTIIDTKNNNKKDTILFMLLGIFHRDGKTDCLSAVTESPFTFDEIRSGKVFGVQFDRFWTNVYVHLPEELKYLLPKDA